MYVLGSGGGGGSDGSVDVPLLRRLRRQGTATGRTRQTSLVFTDARCRSQSRRRATAGTGRPTKTTVASFRRVQCRGSTQQRVSAPHTHTHINAHFLPNMNSRSLYAITRPSVACKVRAPYSGGSNLRQYFYGIRYLGHPLTSTKNFTEIVQREPLRRGS